MHSIIVGLQALSKQVPLLDVNASVVPGFHPPLLAYYASFLGKCMGDSRNGTRNAKKTASIEMPAGALALTTPGNLHHFISLWTALTPDEICSAPLHRLDKSQFIRQPDQTYGCNA